MSVVGEKPRETTPPLLTSPSTPVYLFPSMLVRVSDDSTGHQRFSRLFRANPPPQSASAFVGGQFEALFGAAGDAHISDVHALRDHFGDQFRFDPEPIRLDGDAPDEIPSEGLVAGFHVAVWWKAKGAIRPNFHKCISNDFMGAKITSDAGLFLLVKWTYDLACLSKPHPGSRTGGLPPGSYHSLLQLLRRKAQQAAAGYEGCRDADHLRVDPALESALGKNMTAGPVSRCSAAPKTIFSDCSIVREATIATIDECDYLGF
jgi:hypothetical protein